MLKPGRKEVKVEGGGGGGATGTNGAWEGEAELAKLVRGAVFASVPSTCKTAKRGKCTNWAARLFEHRVAWRMI